MTARIVLFVLTAMFTILFFVFPEYRFPYANLVMYALWIICTVAESFGNRNKTLLNNKLMKFISNISMEMYLCHMMMFRAVGFLHLEKYVTNNNALYIVYSGLVIVSAAIFSLLWKKIEKNICKFGEKM